ncbi:hypothetical protein PPERSA_08331 [Pseudocohnilembus persalinus]|uniref:RING-type domain-containing protein n=1 Tax=Pseudocohnilembus persalinus TaxID=266149 RepID=A0A0V0QPM8_PSEPJ|nr:hypothetical protein PPERSA_08331 [Pseudocohnilembus persalinus]|eukprot:KRX04116.1 hypothetical protein PPERSA_08331 [Pseudocohnilembus persalinus]
MYLNPKKKPQKAILALLILNFLFFCKTTINAQEVLGLNSASSFRQTAQNNNQFTFTLPANFFDNYNGLEIKMEYEQKIKQKPSQNTLFLVASSQNFLSQNFSPLELKYMLMYQNNPYLSLDSNRQSQLNVANLNLLENLTDQFFIDYPNFATQDSQTVFIPKKFLQQNLNADTIYIEVFLDTTFFSDNTQTVVENLMDSSLVENDFKYSVTVKGSQKDNFCDFIGCGKFDDQDKCKNQYDNQYICECEDREKFGENCNSETTGEFLEEGEQIEFTAKGQQWKIIGIEIDEDAGNYQIQLNSRKNAAFASFITSENQAQKPNFLESLYNLKTSQNVTNFIYKQPGSDDEEDYLFMGYFVIDPNESEDVTVSLEQTYDPDEEDQQFAEKTKRLGNLVLFRNRQNQLNNQNKIQQESIDKYMPVILLSDLKKNNDPTVSDDENIECMVCLENLIDSDEIRKTICNHIMHSKCIDLWLVKHTNCPFCRTSFLTKDIEEFLQKKEEERKQQEKNKNNDKNGNSNNKKNQNNQNNQNNHDNNSSQNQNSAQNQIQQQSEASSQQEQIIDLSCSNTDQKIQKNSLQVFSESPKTSCHNEDFQDKNQEIVENQKNINLNNKINKKNQNINENKNQINLNIPKSSSLNVNSAQNKDTYKQNQKQNQSLQQPNLINAQSIQIKNNSDQISQKKNAQKRNQISIKAFDENL